MQRIGRQMGELLDEIRHRALKRDFERRSVQGAGAEHLDGQGALVDLLGIFQRVENIGIRRAGCRVHQPAEGENEIIRRHRVAVRPSGLRPQMEEIDRLVVIDAPVARDAGSEHAAAVMHDEPFKELAQNIAFDDGRCLMRIERARIAGLAAMPDHRRMGIAEAADEKKNARKKQGAVRVPSPRPSRVCPTWVFANAKLGLARAWTGEGARRSRADEGLVATAFQWFGPY